MIHFLAKIQPRTVIVSALIVAALMFGSAIVELNENRNELFHLLQEHALSLSETIANSSENIVLSTDQIEHQISERLLNNALFIQRLDSLGLLSSGQLRSIAKTNDIFRINILSRTGERVLSNHTPDKHRQMLKEKHSPADFIAPILSGKQDRLVIGLKEARFEQGERYAVAVKRTKPGGGAIVLNLDAEELVRFRKRIGIGKLIQDLGNNEGIEYVVLQDRDGILAATKVVNDMSSVDNDLLLADVMDRDTVLTRQTKFETRDVYEVVRRLNIENAAVGVLRIGLSMDQIRMVDERMQRRLAIMSVVFMGLSLLIGAFLIATRKYNIVSRSYERYQLQTGNILEHMGDAVVVVDGNSVITVVNKQAETLFGMTAGGVIGKRIDDLSGDSAQCLKTILANKLRQFETTVRCPHVYNGERNVVVTRSEILSGDGSAESITVVIKDVTETKRLEMEMQRKEKLTAMGQLASGVAHEIRNPLNAIVMIAQRFQNEFQPKKGIREYNELTGVLKSESTRINGIIQQFLKFARPKPPQFSDINVAEFIDRVTALFRSQAAEKHIAFTSSSVKKMIMIDPELMTQALLNLLQNALDATPEYGTISLSARTSGTGTVIEVKDSGNGVPDDQKERIFNLYYTTKNKGTGLGLPITQQIIAQHNGTISVRNADPSGAVFTIELPDTRTAL